MEEEILTAEETMKYIGSATKDIIKEVEIPSPLPIDKGGTNATSEETARANLGAASKTDLDNLKTTVDGKQNSLTFPLSVSNGGTGKSSATAYQPLVGGTSTTAALQSVTSTNIGFLYRSSTMSLPVWHTAATVRTDLGLGPLATLSLPDSATV